MGAIFKAFCVSAFPLPFLRDAVGVDRIKDNKKNGDALPVFLFKFLSILRACCPLLVVAFLFANLRDSSLNLPVK